MSGRDNLHRVLALADDADVRDGLLAYTRHHLTLERIAKEFKVTLPGAVATFCALSPNNDYFGNLRSTVTLLKGFREGVPLEELTVSTYKACARRAWRVLNGEDFLDFTKGPKTRAFYQNIIDPSDPVPVTIDGHMMSIWRGRRMTMKEAVYERPRLRYEEIADGVRSVAKSVGWLPNQVQATLWFTWKRIHNILYRSQLDLFKQEDPWLMDLEPHEIRGFARKSK